MEGKKDWSVEELKNNIYLEMDVYGAQIDLKTVKEISKKNWFNKIMDKAVPFEVDKAKYDVDYVVYMPDYLAIEVDNKFGDVLIDDHKGKVKMKVNYGDIRMGSMTGSVDAEVKFGKLVAGELDFAKIYLFGGKLKLAKAREVKLVANATDINIGEIEDLTIDADKGEVQITNAGTIRAALRFLDFEVDNVRDYLDIDASLSEVRVSKVEPSFKSIIINSKLTDNYIGIGDNGFTIQGKFLNSKSIKFPEHVENNDSYNNLDTENIEFSFSHGTKASGEIKVSGEKSSFKFF